MNQVKILYLKPHNVFKRFLTIYLTSIKFLIPLYNDYNRVIFFQKVTDRFIKNAYYSQLQYVSATILFR